VKALIDRLLASPEPCVRFKVTVGVLASRTDASRVEELQNEVRASARVRTLFSEKDEKEADERICDCQCSLRAQKSGKALIQNRRSYPTCGFS
jgi:hypothetical protein